MRNDSTKLHRFLKIWSSIADEQATYRCPYKNRFDHCTAKFGCRNQRKIDEGTGLLCVGDDKLDYRNAWETDETDETTQPNKKPKGTIACDGKVYQLTPGKTVFDYADDLVVQVPTSCFRTGQCHECIVEIKSGMDSLRPPNEAEAFLKDNYRLACPKPLFWILMSILNLHHYAARQRFSHISTPTAQNRVLIHPHPLIPWSHIAMELSITTMNLLIGIVDISMDLP